MSGQHADEGPEPPGSFGRPFLKGQIRAAAPGASPARDGHEATIAKPRPYLLTGGRTGGGAAGIGIETILLRDDDVPLRGGAAAALFVILAACTVPVAVAEVAAATGLPIGVVQVLAGDLVHTGSLLRSSPAAAALVNDVSFLERLIRGVVAL